MSSQKMKPEFYPDCDFVSIRDKEGIARNEIHHAEKRLAKCSFSESQIHQYKAEIWDSSEDLSDSEIDERDTKIMKSDYFNFLQCFDGLTLVLHRQCLLSLPSQISTKEVLKYVRVLELLALLRLISNEMSQTRFELVQSVLHSMGPEAILARKKKDDPSQGGKKKGESYEPLRNLAIELYEKHKPWRSTRQAARSSELKEAINELAREKNLSNPKFRTIYEDWLLPHVNKK